MSRACSGKTPTRLPPESIFRKSPRPLDAVRSDGKTHAIGEREQAPRLPGSDDRIGQKDVVDTGVGEDLRLPRLGESDASGAGGELHARHPRNLVRLGVRAKLHACFFRSCGLPGDVRLEDFQVDQNRRGLQVFDGCHAFFPLSKVWSYQLTAISFQPTPVRRFVRLRAES
jgi:hypothetical protein